MFILRLEPTIPLDTPKGPGQAHLVINPGDQQHLQWVTFLNATGECWTWQNPDIRLASNITMGIRTEEGIREPTR
jgi:hypothetical protein